MILRWFVSLLYLNADVKSILHINSEDVLVTKQIVEAGKLLDIEVLDHLIIGAGRYVSLKDRGLGGL